MRPSDKIINAWASKSLYDWEFHATLFEACYIHTSSYASQSYVFRVTTSEYHTCIDSWSTGIYDITSFIVTNVNAQFNFPLIQEAIAIVKALTDRDKCASMYLWMHYYFDIFDTAYIGYIATNETVNLMVPTFSQPTLATSVNNWIVMQQRIDQATSFSMGWAYAKSGLRLLDGNIWLGLEAVYQLTKSYQASLRIEMLTTTGNWFSAEYAGFFLDAETNQYAIHVTGYSGDSGDIMWNQNGMKYSTATNDNDLSPYNCAMRSHGGFWYNACFNFNLNGNSTSYYGWLNGVQYFFVSSRMLFKINPWINSISKHVCMKCI